MLEKNQATEQERVYRVVRIIKSEWTRLKEQVEVKTQKQRQQLKLSKEIKISQGSSESMWESAGELREFEKDLMIRDKELMNSNNRVAILEKMQEQPYFGRIDYHDEDGQETIYIGIGSLFDDNDNLVVDWRSPIASLYYEGNKGDSVKIKVGQQTLLFDIDLKRQFLIRDAEIVRMLDTDNVMGDPYLLEVLEGHSSYQMGAVVSTLQKEQNQIVRETRKAVTLIEGVAGSGKTVVLMQKIAYLLYTFRDQLTAEEIVLFSPNKIFQAYISQVLPALGELNVDSTTFKDFMKRKVPQFKLVSHQDERLTNVALLKDSLAFYDALKRYAAVLKKRYMRFADISFQDEVLLSKEEISALFYSIDSEGTLASKLIILQNKLLLKINLIKVEQMKAVWVEEAIMNLSDRNLRHYELQSRNKKAMEDELAEQIIDTAFESIENKIEALAFVRYQNQYIHFLKAVPKLVNLSDFGLDEATWKEHIAITTNHMKHKQLLLEDMDAYDSLVRLMRGPTSAKKYKYICLDEVQDFSPFQLQMLKDSYPTARFVMSGDLNQNILMKRMSFADLKTIFADSSFEAYQLLTSYRSTNEIVQFSNSFIEHEIPAGSFIRSGEKPVVIETKEKANYLDYVKRKVAESTETGLRVAFIGKNYAEAERFCHELEEAGIPFKSVQRDTDNSHHPVIVIPAQLAKGLEFDVVFALCHYPSETVIDNELQIVYTICSRAMHELYFMVPDREDPLVKRVNPDNYQLA